MGAFTSFILLQNPDVRNALNGPDIEILSELAARVVVQSKGAIALATDPRTLVHLIEVLGTPRYRLDQPPAPDDGWSISPVRENDVRVPPFSRDGATECSRWFGPAGAAAEAVVGALPPGEYLLLKSRRRPHATPFVYFGNQRSVAPPYAKTIRDERPFYAYLIEAAANACVVHPRVAVGVSILNYFGNSRVQGTLFFSDLDSFDLPAPGDLDHTVLVLPLRGSLVLDNLGTFSVEEEVVSRERWADSQAWQLAAWLVQDDRLLRG
ncbi:MAG: hypothetical protein U0324_15400 [Polyangiales bacterium]